jgi:uncharacterized protein
MRVAALIRVALDTNVLLSALLSPRGYPDTIYRAWRAARLELVSSTAQLDELRGASRYPKFKAVLQPHHVGAMVYNLQRAVVLDRLPALSGDLATDDPFDTFLIAMSVAGAADYLVSGDHRVGLLQRGSIGRTRIVTSGMFCAEAI